MEDLASLVWSSPQNKTTVAQGANTQPMNPVSQTTLRPAMNAFGASPGITPGVSPAMQPRMMQPMAASNAAPKKGLLIFV
jgi:hypothetical protein